MTPEPPQTCTPFWVSISGKDTSHLAAQGDRCKLLSCGLAKPSANPTASALLQDCDPPLSRLHGSLLPGLPLGLPPPSNPYPLLPSG